MNPDLQGINQSKGKELALSSSFHRSVYSEIEEVGWEHLVWLGEDLTFISFRILDKKGQAHIMVIHLPESYPKCAPSISALCLGCPFFCMTTEPLCTDSSKWDVPYLCELKWSVISRLKDVVQQFCEDVVYHVSNSCAHECTHIQHLEKFQEFWSTLDNIDRALWVLHLRQPSRATSWRQINLGNDCNIIVAINAYNPRSLPECRFLGPDSIVDSMRKTWKRNNKRWMKDKSFPENLASILETSLPQPPDALKDDQQAECGICYAHSLPIDDELGAKSGSGPDYTCDNSSCNRAFHSVCLGDWLRSITTTRQSFDVLFGNCPYCSGPVAVKVC